MDRIVDEVMQQTEAEGDSQVIESDGAVLLV
jgi:hypothetical protein